MSPILMSSSKVKTEMNTHQVTSAWDLVIYTKLKTIGKYWNAPRKLTIDGCFRGPQSHVEWWFEDELFSSSRLTKLHEFREWIKLKMVRIVLES